MLLLLFALQSLALCSAQLVFNCYNLSVVAPDYLKVCNYTGKLISGGLFELNYDARKQYNLSLSPDPKGDAPIQIILQARVNSGYYTTVGKWIHDLQQSRVESCRSQDDTLIVNATDLTGLEFSWMAPDHQIEGITFHYTVVTLGNGTCTNHVSDIVYPRDPANMMMIRTHGSLMVVSWCLLAPFAIFLALFYKRVCIRGEWFYIHIVIQILTLMLNIASIVVIFVYGYFHGRWLNTTNLNWPHQVIGLFTVLLLLINPFLAICRCHQDSKFRWIYNYIHGSIGIVALLCSLTAMLLGLHIYKTLVGYTANSHYAIYALSGTTAAILISLALFNIYNMNFNIRTANKTYIDDDTPTSDWCCRVALGIVILLLMLGGTVATIATMTIA